MKRLISLLFGIAIAIPLVGVPKDLKALDTHLTYAELKAYEEKKANDEWSDQLVAYSQTLVGKKTGQCVLSLRNYFGVPKSEVQGMAKHTKANSSVGQVGSVIIFKNMSKYGHVGILIKDQGDSWLYFHSNIDWHGTGRINSIRKDDYRISGYRIINYN